MSTDQEIIRIGKQLEKAVNEDTPVSPFVFRCSLSSPVRLLQLKRTLLFFCYI